MNVERQKIMEEIDRFRRLSEQVTDAQASASIKFLIEELEAKLKSLPSDE